MKVSRGDVVLLDFPFSDASGSKVRPAVVVQNNSHNRRLNSTIVVLVTKTIRRTRREATQFLIQANSTAGAEAGLRVDSAVVCTNVYTVHEDFVRYRIGRLPERSSPRSTAVSRRRWGSLSLAPVIPRACPEPVEGSAEESGLQLRIRPR